MTGRLILLLTLVSCAVFQPDELSMTYERGFGHYDADPWEAPISEDQHTIGFGLTWYIGTTMPPARAAVLQPGLLEDDEPPKPAPPQPPASVAPATSATEPYSPAMDRALIYQITTLLGAFVVAYQNRQRLPGVKKASDEGSAE